MPTVTLPIKVYNDFQLKLVAKFLKSMLRGLKAETIIQGISSHRLVQIAVSGEDENVALNYLSEEIGLCPTSLEHIKRFSRVKGYIASFSKKELYIDIGIFSPSIIDAAIPLKRLQAQLVDGRKVALKKIANLFGFVENLPLIVKIYSVDRERSCVEAGLSEKQLALYRSWTESLLDRLLILGVSFNDVMRNLKRTMFSRDVVNIERLGFFENAVVCKLGTDALGLVPKVGRRLRNADFSIFTPRKILKFFGDNSAV